MLWVDLCPHLRSLLDSERTTMELIRHISETQQKLKKLVRNIRYALQCVCGHYVDDIGEHFVASHV